jgi:hypothetical protein
MDLGPAADSADEIWVELGGPGLILQMKEEQDRGVGMGQGCRELVVDEYPRLVAVQVEHPEADLTDLQREGENRGDPDFQYGRAEAWPPSGGGSGEIGLEDWLPLTRSVQARTLTEGELQLLHGCRHTVGGPNDSFMTAL